MRPHIVCLYLTIYRPFQGYLRGALKAIATSTSWSNFLIVERRFKCDCDKEWLDLDGLTPETKHLYGEPRFRWLMGDVLGCLWRSSPLTIISSKGEFGHDSLILCDDVSCLFGVYVELNPQGHRLSVNLRVNMMILWFA